MTDSGTGSSSKLLQESLSVAGPSPTDPHTPQGGLSSSSAMLSVDFSTPLAETARLERIKQMTQNHLAFEKSRLTQEILVKAQHALRRMPGVSSPEANELVSQLQTVGQMISQETSQLVDALMNVTLDREETDKAMARMSIDANLAQARTDDQAQTISDLRAEVKAEREKRERIEAEAKQALQRFEALGEELNRVRAVVEEGGEPTSPDDLVQVGESACREGSPQAMRRAQSLAHEVRQMDRRVLGAAPAWLGDQRQCRAAEGAQGFQGGDRRVVVQQVVQQRAQQRAQQQKALLADMARTPLEGGGGGGDGMARTPMAAPPKFGPLQAGPPRAPAAMTHDRRYQGGWAGQGRPCSTGAGGGFTGSSAFSNPPRKGGFQPLPRYRPGVGAGADNHVHGHNHGHNHGHCSASASASAAPHECGRPASSFGHGREHYPSTPTSAGRGRFGRLETPVPAPLDFGGAFSAPAIHLTERAMAAWNEQVMDFYGAIRHFVARHAGEPELDLLPLSRSGLWPVMLAMHHPLSEPEAASYLGFHLRNENSKACVVTRVIVDYVVNRVWVPGAWTGSDSKTTYDLMDLQRELDATQGQPSSARQPLLNQLASIVGLIMTNEQATAWHKHKVDDIARMLQTTVRPLLNRFASPADALRDVEHVAELAWELSSKMLCSRLTFDFRFPDIGARFSSQSMLPIWPRMDPADLQAKHWRVAFVTTPAITCRNDTGTGISAHSVSLADVLCMQ